MKIAHLTGIPSVSTVHWLANTDMSATAQATHAAKHAWNCKLT
jgi:hypothetical protein